MYTERRWLKPLGGQLVYHGLSVHVSLSHIRAAAMATSSVSLSTLLLLFSITSAHLRIFCGFVWLEEVFGGGLGCVKAEGNGYQLLFCTQYEKSLWEI